MDLFDFLLAAAAVYILSCLVSEVQHIGNEVSRVADALHRLADQGEIEEFPAAHPTEQPQ